MNVVKFLGALLVVGAVLFLVVVNYSTIETRFECQGNMTSKGASKPAKVFMKLAMYRWWVGLWSDSDAALWIEIPTEPFIHHGYYGHVVEVGDQLQIYDFGKRIIDLQGSFSTLSKILSLNTPFGLFDGACKKIDT